MKRFLFFLSLWLFLSFTATSTAKTLTIVVNGFKENKGKLMIGIYNSDATFMKKTFKGYAAEVIDTSLEFSVELPEGEYAISVYHDANDNNKLDTGVFGIPSEAYGFSNNAKGYVGAPSYEKAKFTLTTDNLVVRINLID
ncbi:MAG: DUF2141 domain-containing protein [Prevotellaceae bacterium]|jgi:uncharacterized protein (DUF2141 family)|nr:DUF2141 domain-containing protein [Prevotellaceae bacterium]